MRFQAKLPPPVGPGDRVGIAALSGPVDGECLERGIAALEGLGLRPEPAANLLRRRGPFAGSDDERLEGFHRLVADPGLRAIFFARGGHGLLRLLPRLDWASMGRFPRAYVGYSDLTPLLLELTRRHGLVTFHGPMVATDLARGLTAEEESSLLASLAGEFPCTLPVRRWVRRGTASGPLLGGCLSLLAATLGTPFAPRLSGALVFLEDVGEPVYRLDRMLTHLRLSGTLADVTGMLIGNLEWRQSEEDPEAAWQQLVDINLAADSWPLAAGLPSGHCSPNHTLPVGLICRLDETLSQLVLGEA